jgi:hypothetical protein
MAAVGICDDNRTGFERLNRGARHYGFASWSSRRLETDECAEATPNWEGSRSPGRATTAAQAGFCNQRSEAPGRPVLEPELNRDLYSKERTCL